MLLDDVSDRAFGADNPTAHQMYRIDHGSSLLVMLAHG